jgi:TolB-like protein/Tfp pilus assembly protein PilF
MKVLREFQKISKRTPEDGDTTKSGRLVYKFGPFILDQLERVLLHGEESVSLTPKVFDTLVVLVESAGHLVTKEKLLQEVWPDTFVEEANLSVNIAVLRKALGKGVGKRQYIETISKRGYRFAADVVKEERQSGESVELAATQTSSPNSTGGEPRGATFLAVLPFENVSADPNFEYLSDGLTESIINGLSQLKNLRVAARNTVFRYKATRGMDPQDIGRELGVCSVVTGRILPLGDRLIISTELVDVTNGWQLWGEQYHRGLSDILTIQEEISEAICSRLKARLTREEKERLGKNYTEDPEAYHLYLKGRYHWNKYAEQGLRKAIDYFSQAIEVDPTYALAYAGLADSYYRLSNVYLPPTEAMPKVKAAAQKALEIDESLAEAHAALGLVNMTFEWDWPAAEIEFERAIALKPNYALAHQRFGFFFNVQARYDKALREMQVAVELDPLSPQLLLSLGSTFFLMRDYDQAAKQCENALEMNSNYHPALYLLGRIYVQQSKLTDAIEILQKTFAIDGAPIFHAALGRAYALAGQERSARSVLTEMEHQSKERYVSGCLKAIIHLALGDKNRTFECLEEALSNRCEMMPLLNVDPEYDSIRRDLRFTKLLRRVGLDRECQFQKSAAS